MLTPSYGYTRNEIVATVQSEPIDKPSKQKITESWSNFENHTPPEEMDLDPVKQNQQTRNLLTVYLSMEITP